MPGANSATAVPFVPPVEHTAGVDVVTATGRPDDAVGLAVTGDWTIVLFERPGNVMVWEARLTVKDRGRSGAGL